MIAVFPVKVFHVNALTWRRELLRCKSQEMPTIKDYISTSYRLSGDLCHQSVFEAFFTDVNIKK